MKKTEKPIKRAKLLPDKQFKKIWDDSESSSVESVLKKYTSINSKDYIDFDKKYRIEAFQASQMIRSIHYAANLTFREILEASGKRKVDISNIFFIPLRTIDDWYSGKTICKSCYRVAMIKQFHLLNLGKYITLESEQEYKDTIPRVYAMTGVYSKQKYNVDIKEEDIDEEDDFLEGRYKPTDLAGNLKKFDDTHKGSKSSFSYDLSYLDKYLHRDKTQD